MQKFKPAFFLAFVFIFLGGHLSGLSAEKTVIRADRMLDVVSGEIVKDAHIVVEGRKIAEAGDSSLAKGAEIVDLGDMTLLPGLIDMHVHLGYDYRLRHARGADRQKVSRNLICMKEEFK